MGISVLNICGDGACVVLYGVMVNLSLFLTGKGRHNSVTLSCICLFGTAIPQSFLGDGPLEALSFQGAPLHQNEQAVRALMLGSASHSFKSLAIFK